MAEIIPYSGPAPYQGTLSEPAFKNPIEKAVDYVANLSYVSPQTAQTISSTVHPTPSSSYPSTYQSPVPLGPNPVQGPAPVANPNPAPQTQQTGNGFDWNLWKNVGYNDEAAARAIFANNGGVNPGQPNTSAPSFDVNQEYALIDQAYNPQYNTLNSNESALNESKTSALQEAEDAYKLQQGLASGQLGTAQSQLGEIGVKGQSAYESALAQARSVYDQLQRGYQQRFGGSSSAGQAATEIGNVERLKQQGQSYKQLQDVNRQVEMGKQEAQKTYDQNLLQLEQNKKSAIREVTREFNDRLRQIAASRDMIDSAKANAKLAALQGLRQQVLQVQQQETSFRQQLEMQKQQNQMALDTYAKQLAMSQGGVTAKVNPAIDRMKLPVTTNLQANPVNQPLADQYTGQINPYSKDYLNQGIMTPYMKSKLSELGYTI